MIKVDKGIPIPLGKYGYPFDEMEVGDSFYVDSKLSGAINAMGNWNRNNPNKRIVSRTQGKGRRFWRTK